MCHPDVYIYVSKVVRIRDYFEDAESCPRAELSGEHWIRHRGVCTPHTHTHSLTAPEGLMIINTVHPHKVVNVRAAGKLANSSRPDL
jgi:hypothetical protein